MGCFLGCFGASKDNKKRLKNSYIAHHNADIRNEYSPIHETIDTKQDFSVGPIKTPIFETRVNTEEKLSSTDQGKEEEQLVSGARKKVTFDSNVKEYQHVSSDETTEILEDEIVVDCSKPGKSSSTSDSGSTLSSLGSFPPNHRYQNCRESDDDMDEELDCQVSDLDEDELDEEAYDAEYSDDDYNSRQVPELSTRSCSSMESGTKSSMAFAANDQHNDVLKTAHEYLDKETNTPPGFHRGARDRAGYVHAVLNPVENTAQWKNLKAKRTPQLKQQKENFQMDLGFKLSSSKSKSKLDGLENNYEVAVDASLSTWLDSSQKTPPKKTTPMGLEPISSGDGISSHGSNSVTLQEERPILGALTVEKLKQFSASSPISPRQSPNQKPVAGTVGIHWNGSNDQTPVVNSGSSSSFKGIPNTTSKYKEDKRVNWHSTPFETRLERALNRGATDS